MADEKLMMPAGYDPEAPPENLTNESNLEQQRQDLVDGLKTLRTVLYQQKLLDTKRKQLMKRLLPLMTQPVTLLDPFTGEPLFAAAQQSRPVKVDAAELLAEMIRQGIPEEDAIVKLDDVLKPREVDTKENGLLQKAIERGDIPVEVYAAVAREEPSSAYIAFPKPDRGATQ